MSMISNVVAHRRLAAGLGHLRACWGFIVAAGLGIGVLAAVLFFHAAGPATTELALSSFVVKTADAEAAPRMTNEAAAAAGRTELTKSLADTMGSNALINGHPLGVKDMHLVDSAFLPAAVEATSSVSTYRFKSSEPMNVWIFIYQADGVDLPDSGIYNGQAEAAIVLRDASGEVASVSVGAWDPDGMPGK